MTPTSRTLGDTNRCDNCGLVGPTENWGGTHDATSLARNPHLVQQWCRKCVLTAQVAYMQPIVEKFPKVKHELDALLAAEGPQENSQALPAEGLEIIVNGCPVQVQAGPIRDVIASAIQQANQIGAPIDQWVLRTTEGEIIPHALPGGVEWALTGGQRLWLHLGLPDPRN